MSQNELTISKEGQGEAERGSVFDFLYHDSRRIASFLSQFDDNGLLTRLTKGESVTKGTKRSKKFGIGADVPIAGGGKLEFEIGPGEADTANLERSYDPLWANARQFLDVSTERGMLQRSIASASIGQFVLATGYLSIRDLAMFKEAWALPSIQRKIKAGDGNGQKVSNMTFAQKAAAREEQENAALFFDMIQIMPHSVHAQLITSSDDSPSMIWCTLNQENMVSPASDIALSYGEMMKGEWTVMGVLSAYPEYLAPSLEQQFDPDNFGLTESVVGQLSKMLAPIVRVALGRPSAAYAVTPLLIFREVS